MSAFNYCSIGRRYRATLLRITILHCYHPKPCMPKAQDQTYMNFRFPILNYLLKYLIRLAHLRMHRFIMFYCYIVLPGISAKKNLNPVFTNMRHTHAPGSVLINVNPQLVLAISALQMRACCFGRIAATFDHGSF